MNNHAPKHLGRNPFNHRLGSLLAGLFGSLLFVAAMSSTLHAGELIANGNFSANASGYTGFNGYDASGGIDPSDPNPVAPANWTPSSPSAEIGVNGADTSFNTFAPQFQTINTGGSVTDFAFIQDANFNTPSLSQNFNVVAGDTYTLTYDAALRNYGDIAGNGLEAVVSDDDAAGTVLFDQSSTLTTVEFDANTTPGLFTQSAAATLQGATGDTFTADTTGEVTLTFSTLNVTTNGGDVTADVSNVQVIDAPEPSAFAMMFVGAVGVGFCLRRKLAYLSEQNSMLGGVNPKKTIFNIASLLFIFSMSLHAQIVVTGITADYSGSANVDQVVAGGIPPVESSDSFNNGGVSELNIPYEQTVTSYFPDGTFADSVTFSINYSYSSNGITGNALGVINVNPNYIQNGLFAEANINTTLTFQFDVPDAAAYVFSAGVSDNAGGLFADGASVNLSQLGYSAANYSSPPTSMGSTVIPMQGPFTLDANISQGTSSSGSVSFDFSLLPQEVPEPSSWALILGSIAVLGLCIRHPLVSRFFKSSNHF